MTRRRPVHRLTSALIGAIVTACGALTIALLSGYDLDTELIAIVSLGAIGGWLLITALLAGRSPRRPGTEFTGGVPAQPSAPGAFAGPPAPYASSGADLDADISHDADAAPADAAPADAAAAPTPPLTAAARRAAERAAEKARKQAAEEV